MRIFGFNISVYRIKSFLLCGMILSCLFYFSSSIINFHVCVLGIFILLALGLSAVSLWLLKRSLNRKKMGKLRFLYDLSSVCINLLLLDELSYAKFNQEESGLLFKVIAERSERSSTVITTNLEFSKWTEMFSNAALVSALVDRLTYHSHILNMNGNSYRLQSHVEKKES